MTMQIADNQLGPFIPKQNEPSLYAFFADETTRYGELDELSVAMQNQYQKELNGVGKYQLAFILAAHPLSQVALFDDFLEDNWAELFQWHFYMAQKTGLKIVSQEQLHFIPKENFYDNLFAVPQYHKTTCCGFSYQNIDYVANKSLLSINQQCHSKLELVKYADEFKIPIPHTMLTNICKLGSSEVEAFFSAHKTGVLMKFMGMGGGNNVHEVTSPEECRSILRDFDDNFDVILQEKLDLNKYQEYAVDITITDKDFKLGDIRRVLLGLENKWSPTYALNSTQQKALTSVINYMRAKGYIHPQGYTFGIDFFVNKEKILIGEINARWTRGLVAKNIIDRLDKKGIEFYSICDRLSYNQIHKFKQLMEENLYQVGSAIQDFKLLFVGFSPAYLNTEKHIQIWYIVIGDINAFVKAKQTLFGTNSFTRVDEIARVF